MNNIQTEILNFTNTLFLKETLMGLAMQPKRMYSKYFYDEKGDYIFQQIMHMDEYYLTNAEMDIMKNQSKKIASIIAAGGEVFDLIELGAGDATKSIHLLNKLIENKVDFKYYPIDFSTHVIEDLTQQLPKILPTLNFEGLNGDYFDMLKKATEISDRKKVVLFMGANIGNMSKEEAVDFCKNLKSILAPNDVVMIGFDLKKNPSKILAAYNDKKGITKSFNLNLLNRINQELDGDFNLNHFEHYASYDPESGACRSFLISLIKQRVNIAGTTIYFEKDEFIDMEISQKYSLTEIDQLAEKCGFKVEKYFFDQQEYFVDAVWNVS